MTVREYYLSDGRRIELEESEHSLAKDELLQQAVRVGVLCNEASFHAEATDETRAIGDPTETALLVVADTLVLDVSNERAIHPKVSEQPFQTSTKRMTTLHRTAHGQHFAALKGAPAVVLDACSSYIDAAGNSAVLDTGGQGQIHHRERADGQAGAPSFGFGRQTFRRRSLRRSA